MEVPKWLTQDFVDKIFTGGGKISEAAVEGAVPSGENYCSDMIRVILGQESVVVKANPTGGIINLVQFMKMFEKEKDMYDFMSHLEKLLGEKFSPRRILYQDLLVLEDMKPQGFKTFDRRNQLGLEQCHIAMEKLAKLHVGSICLIPSYTKFAEELYYNHSSPFPHFISSLIEDLAEEVRTWPECSQYADRLKAYAKVAFEKTTQEVIAKRDLVVINHGDYHTNNLMFNGGNMVMVDFQLPRINSPAMDIIYFILTSVRLDVRKYHRKDLLKTYIKYFNSTAEKLQLNPRFTLDTLEAEIAQFKNFGMYTACVRTALVLSDKVEVVKSESLDQVSSTDLYRSKAYRQVMPVFIKEFGELGVF